MIFFLTYDNFFHLIRLYIPVDPSTEDDQECSRHCCNETNKNISISTFKLNIKEDNQLSN